MPVTTHEFTRPVVVRRVLFLSALYLTESAKYASSAVTRFRRSDFIEAMYAFALVLANFGIAMAARMPMITTTIKSSMSVKPLRFIRLFPPLEWIFDMLKRPKLASSQHHFWQSPCLVRHIGR